MGISAFALFAIFNLDRYIISVVFFSKKLNRRDKIRIQIFFRNLFAILIEPVLIDADLDRIFCRFIGHLHYIIIVEIDPLPSSVLVRTVRITVVHLCRNVRQCEFPVLNRTIDFVTGGRFNLLQEIVNTQVQLCPMICLIQSNHAVSVVIRRKCDILSDIPTAALVRPGLTPLHRFFDFFAGLIIIYPGSSKQLEYCPLQPVAGHAVLMLQEL